MRIKYKKIILVQFLLITSCQPPPQTSETQESVDRWNFIPYLSKQVRLSEIAGKKTYKADLMPWTDSYWPVYKLGLARRWGNISQQPPTKIGVADLLETHLMENTKEKPSILLSPSEKYDLIYRLKYNIVTPEPQLKQLTAGLREVELELDKNDDVAAKKKLTQTIFDKVFIDHFTPMSSNFPMTSREIKQFLKSNIQPENKFLNAVGDGQDWGWTGSCHGWAPAALMEQTPKNSALVQIADKEILLSEGDIRALLTMSWASYAPEGTQYFVGNRCNENLDDPDSSGPVDRNGRGYSGKISTLIPPSDENSSSVNDESRGVPFFLVRDFGSLKSYRASLVMIELDQESRQRLFLLISNNPEDWGSNRYRMFYNLKDLTDFLISNDPSKGIPSKVDFYGCWDVNPMVLHTLVIEKLGREKLGFVMDRTQSGQVWNQPVYRAEADVGSPVDIATLDVTRSMRFTPGTVEVSEVVLKLDWMSEPSEPQMSYPQGFDRQHSNRSTYRYLLEVDSQGVVIGGEWGSLTQPRPRNQVIPDFIYGFEKKSIPEDDLRGGFDYSGLIAEIHKCSLKENTDVVFEENGTKIPAVKCPLLSVSR